MSLSLLWQNMTTLVPTVDHHGGTSGLSAPPHGHRSRPPRRNHHRRDRGPACPSQQHQRRPGACSPANPPVPTTGTTTPSPIPLSPMACTSGTCHGPSRIACLAAIRRGSKRVISTSWPYSQDTYETFAAMKSAGFRCYCCGDRRAPHALVATYTWGSHIDVINVRGRHHATAARLPRCDGLDIFAPHQAVWHYLGAVEPTVAAILRLPPPHHPNAPTTTYPAPLTLFVASHEQQPMTITPGTNLSQAYGNNRPYRSRSRDCVVHAGRERYRCQLSSRHIYIRGHSSGAPSRDNYTPLTGGTAPCPWAYPYNACAALPTNAAPMTTPNTLGPPVSNAGTKPASSSDYAPVNDYYRSKKRRVFDGVPSRSTQGRG